MSCYVFGKPVAMTFEQAVDRVTEEPGKQGFGVLTDTDVQATMKKRLGQDMPPYRILGACNPSPRTSNARAVWLRPPHGPTRLSQFTRGLVLGAP